MSPSKRLLLLSSSRLHGYDYLEYASTEVKNFLDKSGVKSVLFIPYALKNYDEYTNTVRSAFEELKLKFKVRGIHEGDSPKEEVQNAEAIFIGGGNTFLLLKTLYDNDLVSLIRHRVCNEGVPYIGSSAGTNVATTSINTTNDMPIVYPPTFDAIKLVPFNINPHYIDPEENSTHKGETRDQRISEYLEIPECKPVLGLREGAILSVEGTRAQVIGVRAAVLFTVNDGKKDIPIGADVSHLL